MKWLWRASLTTLLVLVSVPSPPLAQNIDQLVDAFVEITDKTEYKFERQGVRLNGVTKWSIPIRFNVIGAPSLNVVEVVEAHMKRLAMLSTLEISRSRGFVLNMNGDRENINDVGALHGGFEFATMREDKLHRGHLVNALVDKNGRTPRAWLGNFSIVFGSRVMLTPVFEHLHFGQKFVANL